MDIVLPEDPAIPFLGIFEGDVPTGMKDTCSTMFIAAFFITARSWKQPRCPSTEEWIQKMWYIYTMEYYSAIKKNEFMKFLGQWMDLEGIILSEVTQSQKNSHNTCKLHMPQYRGTTGPRSGSEWVGDWLGVCVWDFLDSIGNVNEINTQFI